MIRFMLVLVVLASMVMADEIFLNRDGQETQVRIVQDNFNSRDVASLVLECNVRSIEATEIETTAGTFTRLSIPGWQSSNNPGSPELPVLCKLVQVPVGGEVSIRVVSSQKLEGTTREYGIAHAVYPNQPSVRKDQKEVPFVYDRGAYSQRSSNPIVAVEELGMLRDSRLVLVQFTPVEYSPVDGQIVFYSNIQAEVVVENADMQATMELKKSASPFFQNSQILTPASLQISNFQRALGYLIVAHKMFEGNKLLEQFVEYKKSIGYNVVIKFVDGATVESVQALVKAEYEASKPTFLLIVGDHGQVPGKSVGQYTDLYYVSTLVGGTTDYLPDMLHGRFSANNVAELEPQIAKTLAYEKREFDANFLKRFALVAGWDGSWAVKRGYPQIRYAFKYYFNESKGYVKPVETGTGLDRNIFLTTKSGDSPKQIVALINSGVGFFNYTAHGSQTDFSDPSFTMGDIDGLNNFNMYPVVIGNCCLTGSFQQPTCFGEKWLRVANKGAIAFIGGSNYTYWDEDLWFGVGNCQLTTEINAGQSPIKEQTTDGMYEAGFGIFGSTMNLKIACNSAIMLAGNLAVNASTSSRKKYYFEVYHLFGDPSLPCYWALK